MKAKVTLKIIEFIIDEEITHCNIYYTSNEPDNYLWPGGWKTNFYPKSISVRDILNSDDILDYLFWANGRGGKYETNNGVKNEEVKH